jgi:23S rRNA (cytidine2498-2'-O)-methyltransferase
MSKRPPLRGRPSAPARPRREPPPAGPPREDRAPRPAREAPVVDVTPRLEPLPAAGDFVWTCREGFEADLVEELLAADRHLAPRVLAPALVATRGAPPVRGGSHDVAFARQGFAVTAAVRATGATDLVARVTAALREAVPAEPPSPWALHVWVPDSAQANRLSRSAETLQRAVEMRAPSLDAHWADRRVASAHAARDTRGFLAQVCLAAPNVALVGGLPAVESVSLHPGGRARMRVPEAAPSRAAMKLEEAFDWLGHGPERGETCVDLGAAPGGWTFVVMERGARVIAVDPGAMAPALMQRRGLTRIRGSAFDFEPHEPVDWLFCDMVWRPLEVAALLAKWARRRWARFLVANIKLPMRRKVEFLARIRAILSEGGWEGVRFRHLYHDREEITLTGYCTR